MKELINLLLDNHFQELITMIWLFLISFEQKNMKIEKVKDCFMI